MGDILTIKEICASFDIGGQYVGCNELSTGNINNTYKVEYIRDGEQKVYIIQRINKTVFPNPEKVMANIVRVTEYVREKISKEGLSSRKFVLRAFLAKDTKKPFIVDDNGDYWRCYRFIKNSVTYDASDDLAVIEGAGSAFGRFQNYLDGFDAKTLYEIIPDFHNTKKRFDALKTAVDKDEYGRVEGVRVEIEKLLAFEQQATKLQDMLDSGQIPLRVTHNDTKCNNVSFDKDTGEPLAVLDLDTVMSGAIAHDYGDAIRFIANTRLEDDPDIDNVSLDLEKYKAFTKGFISQVKGSLTDLEKKTMNLGVLTITVELAVRFLTDYLTGDKYFKTKYPGHNLDRVHNQTALAQDVCKKLDTLNQIIQNY